MLHGWLKMVNWDKRTAELHDGVGGHVSLRFDAGLDSDMARLATRYVKVSGTGRFNDRGGWTSVSVASISDTRSWDQPFDVRSPVEQPLGAVFDPEAVVTAEEPFDVEDFIDAVHAGRDVSEPWAQDLSVPMTEPSPASPG